MRKHSETEVFRITGARQGLADDVRGRQRRYVISMSVRTVSVVLAAVLWNVERHVAIVALVLGVLLPYVAVVMANAGRENAPSLPTTYIPAPLRPMLGSGRDEKPSDAPSDAAPHSAAHSAGDSGPDSAGAESVPEDAAHTSEDGRGGHG
ncbi:DUF3099 domain-containing protein [Streptomyces sp. NBRC 110028]|uniref:DUF3099 domain-containing protein n=1 Tax=Streptomyces sp. NBRC 110028 TaxID=1621260 RepID=UPI0006E27895|nr:DUF3099 domain-containing protein [Streptomyces sp. NBRC 110028]